MIDLEKKMKFYLDIAKGHLVKSGQVATVALFDKLGGPTVPVMLDMTPANATKSHQRVQNAILKDGWDTAVVISDAWMTAAPKPFGDYKRGWVEKQPDRKEVLVVVGGSVETGIIGVLQPYHRDGDTIVFEDLIETPDGYESAFFDNVWDIRKTQAIKEAEREAQHANMH